MAWQNWLRLLRLHDVYPGDLLHQIGPNGQRTPFHYTARYSAIDKRCEGDRTWLFRGADELTTLSGNIYNLLYESLLLLRSQRHSQWAAVHGVAPATVLHILDRRARQPDPTAAYSYPWRHNVVQLNDRDWRVFKASSSPDRDHDFKLGH